jgi:branched-chain amino acid transport system substrate-binding protein
MKRNGSLAVSLVAATLWLGACQSQQGVKVGAVLNATQVSAPVATSIRNGLELGLEAVQADPDLQVAINLEIVDAAGDAGGAAQRLYDDGAIAVIGGITTEDALAIAEVSKKEERVFITPTALSDELSGIARTFFRLYPTALQQASAMANFATETLDVNELVILAAEDRAFTGSLLEGLRTVFAQYDGNVKEVISFASDTRDFTSIVDEALALEPTGLFIAAYSPQTIELLALLRERGYGLTEGKKEWIMTTSVFSHPTSLAEAGASADAVYLTMPAFDPSNEEAPMPAFTAAYRERFGTDPDGYAGHAYDAMLLCAEALKASSNTLPQEFLKGMRAMDPLAGVSGNIQFDEDGNVQQFPRIHMIRGGQLVDYRKWRQEREEEIRSKIDELRQQTMRLRTQGSEN